MFLDNILQENTI